MSMPFDAVCYSLTRMCPVPVPPALVLCLGNFDGVHLAHQRLLLKTADLRKERFPNAACGVFCFLEPPARFLNGSSPEMLCDTEQKLRIFASMGMEYALLVPFEAVCSMTPEVFIKEFLREHCHCVGAVCGFNYRFGKDRAGDVEWMQAHATFPVSVCEAVLFEGETVSSTRIRHLLKEGKIADANRLLTRPYSFTSPVLHGKTLGRRLGAPTVNQHFPDGMLIPQRGVYVTCCTVDGKSYRAVSNVGLRPTVDRDATVNCESFLLDFAGDLYGKEITVSFLDFIRPEEQFDSMDALQEQIQKDIQYAKDHQ